MPAPVGPYSPFVEGGRPRRHLGPARARRRRGRHAGARRRRRRPTSSPRRCATARPSSPRRACATTRWSRPRCSSSTWRDFAACNEVWVVLLRRPPPGAHRDRRRRPAARRARRGRAVGVLGRRLSTVASGGSLIDVVARWLGLRRQPRGRHLRHDHRRGGARGGELEGRDGDARASRRRSWCVALFWVVHAWSDDTGERLEQRRRLRVAPASSRRSSTRRRSCGRCSCRWRRSWSPASPGRATRRRCGSATAHLRGVARRDRADLGDAQPSPGATRSSSRPPQCALVRMRACSCCTSSSSTAGRGQPKR